MNKIVRILGIPLAVAGIATSVEPFLPSIGEAVRSSQPIRYLVALGIGGFVVLLLGLLLSTRKTNCPTQDGISIYGPRDSSDEDMLGDIKKNKSAVVMFLGISHQHLSGYLNRLIALPTQHLEEIHVYYASDNDGNLWEHAAFLENVRKSRFEISFTATTKEAKQSSPRFRKLQFWQRADHSTFGGCLVRGSNGKCRVQYIVNYLPGRFEDTREESLTFRLERRSNDSKKTMKAYSDALDEMHRKAVSLGSVVPSLWDESTNEWSDFTTHCKAYHYSMEFLAKSFGIEPKSFVLDLAGGTGYPSKVLKDKLLPNHLTILDSSPQILHKAKSILGDREVRYSLTTVPTPQCERLIDFDAKFDFIVIHLALPEVAASKEEVRSLAMWCKLVLAPQGRVILAVHNTAVRIDGDPFDPGKDSLREALHRAILDHSLGKIYDGRPRVALTRAEIEGAFKSAGYSVLSVNQKSFNMTMKDRIRLWSCPAVLASVLTSPKVSDDVRDKIIRNVKENVQEQPTPDMTVMYWMFSVGVST